MKTILWVLAGMIATLACAVRLAFGVQPMPGGVRINWTRHTNDLSYYVWRLNPPNTNWGYIGSTTNTWLDYTNSFLNDAMFGVTANQKTTNGQCCVAADVGVAGWPPDISTPAKMVRMTPLTNGIAVAIGRWVKVSSDLKSYDDWLKFKIVGTNVTVEHLASPVRPYLFMAYPVSPVPPMPGGTP
jgi:hypothetical protein